MGKGGGDTTVVQPPPQQAAAAAASAQLAQEQAAQSREVFAQSRDLRSMLFGLEGTDPRGGLIGQTLRPPPLESLQFPQARETIERQFQLGNRDITATLGRGGRAFAARQDLIARRAQSIGQLQVQQRATEVARRQERENLIAQRTFQAAAPSLGITQTGITGIGGAGQTLAQLTGALRPVVSQGQGGKSGAGIGSAVGQIGAAAIMK